MALFGLTAKQWREQYPEEAYECKTLRDCADTHRLIVLSNLENLNAVWIRQGVGKKERYEMMREAAINQLASLQKYLVDPSAIESPNKKKVQSGNTSPEEKRGSFGSIINKISNAGKPESE